MRDIAATKKPRELIQELACLADMAMVTGDNSRCLELVESIYDLLDRQTGQGAPRRAPRL